MLSKLNQTVIRIQKQIRLTAPLLLCCGLPICATANCMQNVQTDPIPRHKEGLTLVWNDEFDHIGTPDPANWNYEYGFVRNQELQWYQPDNARCENGTLIIEGRQQKIANPSYSPTAHDWRNSREYAHYSSSCLITKGLHEWPAGGYYEVRAKIDPRSGSWPAIWLLGTDGEWPDNGEIDMMEFYRINDEPHILANVAWGTAQRYQAAWDSVTKKLSDFTSRDPQWADQFHIWAMKWDSNSIRLYLDGELLNETDLTKTRNADSRNPFVDPQKFYLLLNLAIGANGGTPIDSGFPLRYEVDYVRVYQ
ncbi:family 16 glycosylhydrolase [Mangrovibacterium marinum]|uniref:Glycosyl hydrolase family 16 n=1 Tax=Mangrovibacterium marinum TaxID=1639118 RepID=A0A2T5BYN7_9BACT|nr:glycoside hydrolase family 16 protein [Mangrovibacterium marinum]PTN07357.1 glycosyl hydrolase family 16 [Mangrovibacterium marinum]